MFLSNCSWVSAQDVACSCVPAPWKGRWFDRCTQNISLIYDISKYYAALIIRRLETDFPWCDWRRSHRTYVGRTLTAIALLPASPILDRQSTPNLALDSGVPAYKTDTENTGTKQPLLTLKLPSGGSHPSAGLALTAKALLPALPTVNLSQHITHYWTDGILAYKTNARKIEEKKSKKKTKKNCSSVIPFTHVDTLHVRQGRWQALERKWKRRFCTK